MLISLVMGDVLFFDALFYLDLYLTNFVLSPLVVGRLGFYFVQFLLVIVLSTYQIITQL